jgi:hypothetical protein
MTVSWSYRGRRVFFFVNKKEAKKTSVIWVRAGFDADDPVQKSFLLLFFKKEVLPLLLCFDNGTRS